MLIDTILKTQSLDFSNSIKVNILAKEEIDWDYFYPSMTISYVIALGLPEIKIEIEVWAAG